MSYNGWSNYETWCVSLWLNNDEGAYRHWTAAAQEAYDDSDGDKDKATRRLARQIADDINVPDEVDGMFRDLLTSALSEVDWDEIAAGFMEGVEENDEDDEDDEDSEDDDDEEAEL